MIHFERNIHLIIDDQVEVAFVVVEVGLEGSYVEFILQLQDCVGYAICYSLFTGPRG